MKLSTSFVLVLAAVERALFASAVPDEVYQRDIVDPDGQLLWHPATSGADPNFIPEPIRGVRGYTVTGTENIPIEIEYTDNVAPPNTDGGQVPNMRWSFALSKHVLFQSGFVATTNSSFALPSHMRL